MNFSQDFETNTESCLIQLTDYIRNRSGLCLYSGMLMLDLQKAFDTVDHSILLDKLKAMGVCNHSRKWFESYLTNREQYVQINETNSSPMQVTCVVPQGSILGPLLFLAYVTDMEQSITCKLLLYADDSALLVSDKNLSTIEDKLCTELENIYNWLIDNKLSLHLGKTETILFGPPRKIKNKVIQISCNGTQINQKDIVTYLGTELDNKLTGEEMATKVIKKCNSRIKYLFRKCSFLNTKCKKMLTSSLVTCHMDYASCIWFSSLSMLTKNRFKVIQNKCVRLILNMGFRDSENLEHYSKANIMPIRH